MHRAGQGKPASQVFREASGPQRRGRRGPGLSGTKPVFARAWQSVQVQAELSTLSRLQGACTCLVFFNSLKPRLHTPSAHGSLRAGRVSVG